MVDQWGWDPKVKMKAVWVQGERGVPTANGQKAPVVAEQVAADLEGRRCCPDRRKRHTRKLEIARIASVYTPQEAIVAYNAMRSLRGSNPQPLP